MASPSTDRRFGLTGATAFKAPVQLATTANITLSGEQSIDAVTTSASRVLVKNQTTSSENGIYDSDTGSWTRSADFDGTHDAVQGTLVYVTQGSTNAGLVFQLTTANPVIGTSGLSFSVGLFSGIGNATFIQAGTGAVTRLAQNKMRDIVGGLDHGATADGSTNDAASIQSLITYLDTVRSGEIIAPSPRSTSGTYLTNTTLKIQDAITLAGENREGTIFKTSSDSVNPLQIRNITAPLTNSPYGVFLKDIYVLGTGISNSSTGIVSESIHTSGLVNVSVKSFNYGIIFQPGTDTTAQANNDVYMIGCWIDSNNLININAKKRTDHLAVLCNRIGDSAIGISCVDSSELHVAFSAFYTHTTCDIDIDEQNTPSFALQSNATILANHFEYTDAAAVANIRVGNTQNINGFNAIGNSFAGNAAVTPILLSKCVSPVLIGNTVYYNASALYSASAVTNLVSLGNTVNVVGGGVHGSGTPIPNVIQGATQFGSIAAASGSSHRYQFSDSGNTGTVRIDATNASQTTSIFTVNAVRASTTGFDFANFYNGNLSVLACQIKGNGDLANVNNTYGATSDRKLKENEELAGSQWDDIKILARNVKKFNLKTDPDKRKQIGLVAQDVEITSPGLVYETEDFEEFETGEINKETGQAIFEKVSLGTKTKGVKYSILYMKAIKALGEALERIELLEEKLKHK